jgi:acyl-CoA reductase-like NAD-dependent aldehyde dehydrogenase
MQFQEQVSALAIAYNEIPNNYLIDPIVEQREYLSDGAMIQWAGPTHDVYSPIHVKTNDGVHPFKIGSYPICTEKEALIALDAARAAYNDGRGEWPTMSISNRIKCVENFIKAMLTKKDLVVNLIMWEIGKTHADSVKEFDRTVEYIYLTIDALKDIDRNSSKFTIEQGIAAQIRRSPLGVVLCMGPFNYPLNETFTTLIPAIIMGNTLLFKPPKHGTLLHYPLLEAFKNCFPKGVVNTIYGRGNAIVPPLMKTGKIDVLTLIGSSKVANDLKKLHPKVNRLRAILGLDAKNAAIVTKNANIQLAAKEIMLGALSFNGQRCTAIKIVFAHHSIVDELNNLLIKAFKELQFGLPWEKNVTITALPEPNKPAYLNDLVNDAKKHGANILNEHGGFAEGPFFHPTLLYPVNKQMRVYHEEQFGPIVPVVAYEDIEEPIHYVIESTHGQQVSIFSNNPDEISLLIDPLVNQVSRVNINSQCQRGPDAFPFTGRKDSAEGTLSVVDALRSFSIRTLVAVKLTDENKAIINEIVSADNSNFLSTKYIF